MSHPFRPQILVGCYFHTDSLCYDRKVLAPLGGADHPTPSHMMKDIGTKIRASGLGVGRQEWREGLLRLRRKMIITTMEVGKGSSMWMSVVTGHGATT